MNKQLGFTLIELSIVLVIIGLIVGGVLVGRDLIKAAELRGQIADIEKLGTAVNTFRVKYNALPGDILTVKAEAFGLATGCGYWNSGAGDPGGNGNDRLDDHEATTDRDGHLWDEDRKLFCHLFNAHLVSYNNLSGGPNLVNGHDCWTNDCIGIPTKGSNTYLLDVGYANDGEPPLAQEGFRFWLGDVNSSGNHYPQDAYTIDSKMDDGMPNSGGIRATASYGGEPLHGAAGTMNCVNTDVTPNVYNTTYKAIALCGVGFKVPGYE